uniref:Uncharacterized protein n=1 Tax=viral metagenome TaxID=1070528 RepID=A0A6C0J1V6_9ZZZZ
MYVRGRSKSQQVRAIIRQENPGEIIKREDLIRLIDYSYRRGPYGDLYLEVDRYELF